jgi:type VI secretion system Hcp family effector
MATWLDLPDLPPSRCRSYRHHVHVAMTRSRQAGDSRVVGRSTHDDFSITKELDHTSATLLYLCAASARLDTVVLRVRKPAPPPPEDADPTIEPIDVPWFRFTLENVVITSMLTSVEDSGPIETVTFSYGTIHWAYEGQEPATHHHWVVHP